MCLLIVCYQTVLRKCYLDLYIETSARIQGHPSARYDLVNFPYIFSYTHEYEVVDSRSTANSGRLPLEVQVHTEYRVPIMLHLHTTFILDRPLLELINHFCLTCLD